MALLVASTASAHVRRREHLFFTGVALAATALVVAGFAPTYFLKAWFGLPALPAILHVHGMVMTSWFVLLIVQTALVARGRTDVHRRLGIAGGAIAVMVVVLTVIAAIIGLRVPRGLVAIDPTMVLVSLGSMVQFGAFVSVALLYRRHPDAHKRLMFIATAVLLTAAVGRLIGGPSVLAATAVYVVSDAPVIAMIIYDFVTRGRVHGSLVWGGLILVSAQCLQEIARDTAAGRALVGWLQS
jgi:hypothetical protein